MTDFRVNISHKDPSKRGPLMMIDQVTAITCTDTSDFTSDLFLQL